MRPLALLLITALVASAASEWVTFPGRDFGVKYSYFARPDPNDVRIKMVRRIPFGATRHEAQLAMEGMNFDCRQNTTKDRLSCSRAQFSLLGSAEWRFVFFFSNGALENVWYLPAQALP